MKPLDQYEIEKRDLSRTKKRLDAVSPSFCLAKWLFLKIHLSTGKTQSCYHVPTHFVDKEKIKTHPSALHNTIQKKSERKQMLEGKQPEGCSYCWRIEKEGHLSDRHYQSNAAWASHRFEEIVEKGGEYDVIPSYVEVCLNNTCNFKCSYCYPEFSSSLMRELKNHGPYPTIPQPHNDLEYLKKSNALPMPAHKDNPYEKAFWQWWPELYPKIKVFRLTGGEPLIDHNTFRFLDYILKNPNPDMELSFTTNLCPPENFKTKFRSQIEKIINEKKVGILKLYPSIDSWGPQAEYIRHGLSVREFEENVEFFNQDLNVWTNFIITINALSIFNMKALLQKIVEWRAQLNNSEYRKTGLSHNRINLDMPYLRRPPWQTLEVLPLEMTLHYLNESFVFMEKNVSRSTRKDCPGFSYIQINKLKRVINIVKSHTVPESQLRENRINFYKFFSAHDKRRNTNFLKTFPELKSFWLTCCQLAEEWDAKQSQKSNT